MSQLQSPFPLGLAITAILTTSLGLAASALSIKWGAAPPPGDALPFAWLYVHCALMLTWLLIWPVIASSRLISRVDLLWDLATIAIAAIPAIGVAALFSNISLTHAAPILALQLAVALLAMGAIAWTLARPQCTPLVIAKLAALATATPILAYLWFEFLPRTANPWPTLSPLLLIHQAATQPPTPQFWSTTTIYALLGILLTLLAPQPRRA